MGSVVVLIAKLVCGVEPCIDSKHSLNEPHTTLSLEEPPFYMIDFEVLDLALWKESVIKKLGDVLFILRVLEVETGNFIRLDHLGV